MKFLDIKPDDTFVRHFFSLGVYVVDKDNNVAKLFIVRWDLYPYIGATLHSS